MNNPENIIFHHSLVDYTKGETQLVGVNNYHKKQGYPISSLGYYVGYHYFIEKDGTVTQCRKDSDVGAHTSQQSMNFKSIGICMAGNFDIQEPTQQQVYAMYSIITGLQKKYNIPNAKVVPHRHYATYKSCWGSKLPDNVMQYITGRFTPKPTVSTWAKESVEKAKLKGITDWTNPQEQVGTMTDAWMWHKLGLLESVWNGTAYIPITKGTGVITKEQRAVLFDRLGKL